MFRSLFLSLVLLSSFAKAEGVEESTTRFQAYMLQLLEKQILTDEDLLAWELELEKGQVTNPVLCKKICTSSTRQIHHKAFKTLLAYTMDVIVLQDWLRELLIRRGHHREDRKKVEEKTEKIVYNKMKPVVFSYVGSGSENLCATGADKKIHCWKYQISLETYIHFWEKSLSLDIDDSIQQIRISKFHRCVLKSNGHPVCSHCSHEDRFGSADDLQITLEPNLKDVTQIEVSSDTTCVLQDTGLLKCFSYSDMNSSLKELEAKSIENPVAQIVLANGPDKKKLSCTLDVYGTVSCANVAHGIITDLPEGLEKSVLQIDLSEKFLCVLKRDRIVLCWEYQTSWSQKEITWQEVQVPLEVHDVLEISTGRDKICALLKDRSVYCWTEYDLMNIAPREFQDVLQIHSAFPCALHKSGKILCKGDKIETSPFPEDFIADTSWFHE